MTLQPGAVAMFGSVKLWPLMQTAKAAGRTVYYGDHAYFHRLRQYRVTRDGLQYEVGPKSGTDCTRLGALGVQIKPWRGTGGHVLICPPDEAFSQLMGFSGSDWLAVALQELQANTDRDIRVRDRHTPWPLECDLEGCWALVTYHSNAAVEALCSGIPVFVTGFGAAKPMGLSDLSMIEHPVMPSGRREWAAALANNQWTMAEIADGTCWRMLNEVV